MFIMYFTEKYGEKTIVTFTNKYELPTSLPGALESLCV